MALTLSGDTKRAQIWNLDKPGKPERKFDVPKYLTQTRASAVHGDVVCFKPKIKEDMHIATLTAYLSLGLRANGQHLHNFGSTFRMGPM